MSLIEAFKEEGKWKKRKVPPDDKIIGLVLNPKPQSYAFDGRIEETETGARVVDIFAEEDAKLQDYSYDLEPGQAVRVLWPEHRQTGLGIISVLVSKS